MIAIGATNWQDRRATPFFWGGGSCYGSWIDVCAPGDSIYGLNNLSNTDYGWYWGGTSQATPMVAGLTALLLAQDSARSPTTLKTIIRNTSDDKVGRPTEDTQGFDVFHGYGRINCYRALTYATISVENDPGQKSASFALFANFPNPFNPTTELAYSVPGRQRVTLKIFDMLGREVRTLVDEMKGPGIYTARWDASRFASGTYISRLTAGQLTMSRVMVLVK